MGFGKYTTTIAKYTTVYAQYVFDNINL